MRSPGQCNWSADFVGDGCRPVSDCADACYRGASSILSGSGAGCSAFFCAMMSVLISAIVFHKLVETAPFAHGERSYRQKYRSRVKRNLFQDQCLVASVQLLTRVAYDRT
jgi:hypothetical protein